MGTASSTGLSVGAPAPTSLNNKSHWKLHMGKLHSTDVSVFRAEGAVAAIAEMAKNSFQRTKQTKHPHVLAYVEGSETDKELVVVTEQVTPLSDFLDSDDFRSLSRAQQGAFVASGAKSLLDALEFLHGQGLVHGMVCPHACFVNEAGEWKLWGLDLVSDLNDPAGLAFFQKHDQTLAQLAGDHYRSPERKSQDWGKVAKAAAASDIWALAQLLTEIHDDELPPTLAKLTKRMSMTSPASRGKAGQIAKTAYFQHPVVAALDFIQNLTLKDHNEVLAFLRTLPAVLPTAPPKACVFTFVPALKTCLERSSAQDRRPEENREVVSAVLPLLCEIGKTLSAEDHSRHVAPALLPLFTMNDRAVRMQLLQRVDEVVMHMSEATVNGQVFEPLLTGFADTAKVLRELTLKSMLCLADKLNERNLNDKLVRALARLQADPEPSIRTNTTIFYGRIAAKLKDSNRIRTIVPAFLKALKDPFPHARLAGIRATGSCKSYFDAPLITTKILPTVCQLLLDPFGPVREAALECVQKLLEVVQVRAGEMAVEEAERNRLAKEAAEKEARENPPPVGNASGAAGGVGGDGPASAMPSRSTSFSSMGGMGASGMGASGMGAGASVTTSALPAGGDADGWGSDDDLNLDDDGPAAASTSASAVGSSGDDGWGDDDWGDDDALSAEPAKPAPSVSSASNGASASSTGSSSVKGMSLTKSGSSSSVKGMSLAKPKFGAKKAAAEADGAGSFWDDAMTSGGSAGGGGGAAVAGVGAASFAKSPARKGAVSTGSSGGSAVIESPKQVSSMKLGGATKLKVEKSDADGWDDW